MPRYGIPNPIRGVSNLSRGSKADIKGTNPAQAGKSFATPASVVPKQVKKLDYGLTPHRIGSKTLKMKTSGKASMGK